MKVLVVSTSRADYGGLVAVNKELFKLGVESSFITIRNSPPSNRRMVITDTSDIMMYARDKIEEYEPDMVLICGDRYETLGVATAAYLMQAPIAHLSGGDVTEGSQDDCMRHAVTKLSHLHFPTCFDSWNRIVQLGENPDNIYAFGCPHSDIGEVMPLKQAKFLCGIEKYPDNFILVVWHPNTLVSEQQALDEVVLLSVALGDIDKKKLVIGPNNDAGNAEIKKYWIAWCKLNGHEYRNELQRDVYLSLLKHCACLVGNSSSGFYEAPYLGTMVVNISDRQRGRQLHHHILNSSLKINRIVTAINQAILDGPQPPLKQENSAKEIARVISKIENPKSLLRKQFYDV
jgi:UDP-hydrolysing UDP-N-acetyl-D-glucosamine 2-epimerase